MSMLLRPGTNSGLLDVETMAIFNLPRSRNTDIANKFQCAVSSSTWGVTLTKDKVTRLDSDDTLKEPEALEKLAPLVCVWEVGFRRGRGTGPRRLLVYSPRLVRSVALCQKDDDVLRPMLEAYEDLEVVIAPADLSAR